MKSKVFLSVLSVLVMSSAVGMDKSPVPAKYYSNGLSLEVGDETRTFLKSKSENQLKEIIEWVAPIIKAGNPENFALGWLVLYLPEFYPAARQALLEAYLTGKNDRDYLLLPQLMKDIPESITGNLLKQANGNLLKEAIKRGSHGNEPEYKSMVSLLAKYRLEETVEAVIKTLPMWAEGGLVPIVLGNPRAALSLLREAIVTSEDTNHYYDPEEDLNTFKALFAYNKPDVVADVLCANLLNIKHNFKYIGAAVKEVLPGMQRLQINRCILKNLHKVNPQLLNWIDVDQLTPEQKKILADFEHKQWQDTGFADTFGIRSSASPTKAHLQRITSQGVEGISKQDRNMLGILLFDKDMSSYFNDVRLQRLVKEVHDYQEQGYKGGYYTYIHAHTWPLDFDQRVYAELHPERLGKDFFPLYFLILAKKEAFPEQTAWEKVSEDECIKILLDRGADDRVNGQKYLLSMNVSFFGNLALYSSSTAGFLTTNSSMFMHGVTDITKAIFEDDGYSDIYDKYEAELGKLQQLHKSCSTLGKLWVIMVPKERNKQLVFSAVGGGHQGKSPGEKVPVFINGKPTYDVNVIQEALYKGGQSIKDIDKIQFRMLMTPKTGLNPNLGIKTIPISLADPKCYAEFNAKFEELMKRVKADIAAKQKAMPRAKL